MEHLLFNISFVLSLAETALFYKIIYRRTLHKPKRQHLFLLAGIYALSLAGEVFAWNDFGVSSLTICALPLTGYILTDIRLAEIVKYWIGQFIFSLPIEEGLWQILSLIFPSLHHDDVTVTFIITSLEIILLLCLSKLAIFQSPTPLVLSGKPAVILLTSFGSVSLFLPIMGFMISDLPEKKFQTAGTLFLIFAALGFFIASILLLYIFRQRQHFQQQAALENEYNRQQREYFHILLEKEQETKKFRHDTINHMLCMQNMAAQKKIEEIQKYLTDTLHVLNQISQRNYSVGNETVDVLLNHYLAPIRESCHIETDGAFGEAAHIPQMELCTIFSNILKNAVEAVANIPQESTQKRQITIYASHGEKFMKLTVQNTYTGKLQIQNDVILTNKEDKNSHGFGIENTHAAVKRCGGTFVYQIENGLFSAKVILPVKLAEKK